MNRVTILGSPGTGKTMFAKKLAKQTGLPLIHLDLIYHDKAKNFYNDETAWQRKVKKLLSNDAWIMDGNYNSTLAERVSKADTVFYFDFPRRSALSGVVKRRVRYHGKKRDDMPDDWKETLDWDFLKYVWRFNIEKRPKIIKILTSTKDKEIVVFKNQIQVKRYLADLRK